MHTCVRCANPIIKSGNESAKQFAARKYCDRECFLKAKREQMIQFKDSERKAVENKARVMGGNIKITNAVLNADKVRAIRELNDPLGFSAREISAMFDCKTDLVHKVLRRVTWAHVK